MFIIKKIISPFFQPLSLGLEIIACGLILLWFTRHHRWGRIVTSAGALLILILSLGPVSDSLLRSLEHSSPPFMHESTGKGTVMPPMQIPWIVVLGGGSSSEPRLPANSRLGLESIARLTEAVRLYRMFPESRLILSGGAVFGDTPEADTLAETARIMGVPPRALLLEQQSRDTEEQALMVRALVGNSPFLLVTSAYHMPRSIALFRKEGMAPIPAPAAFMTGQLQFTNPSTYFPAASGMQNAERALHEYLGIVWSWLRGRR